MNKQDMLIVVRGGGDIATGTIHRLWKSGFRLLVLETDYPSAIRRQVSVCEAVYRRETKVEDLTAVRIEPSAWTEWISNPQREENEISIVRKQLLQEIRHCYQLRVVPVLVDAKGISIGLLKPQVVIDAILAKKNLGTGIEMAPLTIALGPGFEAGADVHYVVETMRGHNLGRVIEKGSAMPNTGVPGVIAGYDRERVIHSPAEGRIKPVHKIGDYVNQGEIIAEIIVENGTIVPVLASITGLIRGLITEGYPVTKGFKIADIDPRQNEYDNCFTISDRARCIAGSVLELVCGVMLS